MSTELNEGLVDGAETVIEQGFLQRHRKKMVIFVVLLSLMVGFVLIWYFLRAPAKGNVHTVIQKQQDSFDENQEKRLYKGKFVEFSYRALYAEKSHEIADKGPIQERIWLTAPDVEGRKIAIVVAKREGNDLSSEPSYSMRHNDQATYRSTPLKGMDFDGVVFTNHVAPFEVVAFFRRGGFIISVSLTSLFKSEGLDTELFQILKSLRFPLS